MREIGYKMVDFGNEVLMNKKTRFFFFEKAMISAYSLRITTGRRHRKQRTDRVVEDTGEQLEV